MIFSVVLYGCGTCSVTLREEHRLRMHGKRELRTFGEKRKIDKNKKRIIKLIKLRE
jgi:hypothetical protein